MSKLPYLTMFPSHIWGDRRLNDSDRCVLGVLCAHGDRKTGQCNPSHRTLAEGSGRSLSTVARSLDRLEKLGYIVRLRTERDDGGTGATRYIIVPIFAEQRRREQRAVSA